MSATDERIAAELRARVDAVVPTVVVAVDSVVPRARRRRATRRGLATTAALATVLGVGWFARGLGAGLVDTSPAAPQDPVATASGALASGPAEAVVAADGTVSGVPGDPWDGEARYWYVSTEMAAGEGEPVEHLETWLSRERPGLLVLDGDLERAMGVGPSDVLGELVLDSGRQAVSDPRAVPVDADALARALTGRRQTGRDVDDSTFLKVRDALNRGGLLTRELRDAYWQVAANLPGVRADEEEDARGRPGEALRRTTTDGEEVLLVRDPRTGLLLEARSTTGWWAVYLEQGVADETPVVPSLEPLGCTSWATCGR